VASDHVHTLVDHAVGGFRLLDGKRPVAGDDELGGDLRLHAARAEGEGVDVAQDLRNGLGGDEADLLALAGVPGHHAVEVLALVDVAEVAAHVLPMLALGPEPAAVGETDPGIFLGHLEDVRIEVAERGREEERGAVLLDHRAHGLLHVRRLRHLLLLYHGHARHLLDRRGGLGLRLVVAVVVARADVDDAHHELVARDCGRPVEPRQRPDRPGGSQAQEITASW